MPYTLGDLLLIEVALCEFMKDIDVSMSAGRVIHEIIAKTEMNIAQLQAAVANQGTLNPEKNIAADKTGE